MYKNSPPQSPLRFNNCSGTRNSMSSSSSSYVPTPVYPWSEGSMDFLVTNLLSSSTSTLNNNSNGHTHNHDTPLKSSILDSISRKSTNFSGRLQDRLAASMAGLKELESLREKHRKMVQDVKHYVQFANNDDCINHKFEFSDPHQMRSPSPSPSAAEMSSNISHRSSLSMDSGCLSLASDAASFSHQHTLSTDSSAYFSLPPSRKNSTSTNNGYVPPPSAVTHLVDASDDEGCYVDHSAAALSHLCHSYTSIGAALAHENGGGGTSTIPKAMFGYRRRALLHSRPKSLYSYPEENTVLVEMDNDNEPVVRPRISRASSIQCTNGFQPRPSPLASVDSTVYRANRVYIKPPPRSALVDTNGLSTSSIADYYSPAAAPPPTSLQYAGRRSRPTSFAMPNSLLRGGVAVDDWREGRMQRSNDVGQQTNVFTWEQVKRLLDPAFDTRTLVRHHSTVSVNTNSRIEFMSNKLESTTTASSLATVTRQNGEGSSAPTTRSVSSTTSSQEHIVVSRSVSSQSTDSNKSRKKEKSWRESEHL